MLIGFMVGVCFAVLLLLAFLFGCDVAYERLRVTLSEKQVVELPKSSRDYDEWLARP